MTAAVCHLKPTTDADECGGPATHHVVLRCAGGHLHEADVCGPHAIEVRSRAKRKDAHCLACTEFYRTGKPFTLTCTPITTTEVTRNDV
jgi:hypothetical protein